MFTFLLHSSNNSDRHDLASLLHRTCNDFNHNMMSGQSAAIPGLFENNVTVGTHRQYGNRHDFYALIHRTRADFREVETLAAKYPGIRWVVTHYGSDFKTADQAVETIKKHPNVYAEITYTSVPLGLIEYLVEHAGEDRVLYGSDLSMRDPRQQLGWVVFSRLPTAAKKKVLGLNAWKLLQPCFQRLPVYNRPRVEG